VEHELTFVAYLPKNRVSLYCAGVLCGTIPLQYRRTSRNKEGTTGIHIFVTIITLAVISTLYYRIFLACLLVYFLVTLGNSSSGNLENLLTKPNLKKNKNE
jgi:hypothetical protein